MAIKALNTYYNGFYFRSRLEARWAVFFDACNVKWEYEQQGYDLGDGVWYLPDFLLHDVTFNHASYSRGNDLYVEVKGNMTESDANKILKFAEEKPILVVGDIPRGEFGQALVDDMTDAGYYAQHGVSLFNFETIDDDYFGAYPGIDLDGEFEIFGQDSSYLCSMDDKATVNAYRRARVARFNGGKKIIKEMGLVE